MQPAAMLIPPPIFIAGRIPDCGDVCFADPESGPSSKRFEVTAPAGSDACRDGRTTQKDLRQVPSTCRQRWHSDAKIQHQIAVFLVVLKPDLIASIFPPLVSSHPWNSILIFELEFLVAIFIIVSSPQFLSSACFSPSRPTTGVFLWKYWGATKILVGSKR